MERTVQQSPPSSRSTGTRTDRRSSILEAFAQFETFAGLLDIIPKSGVRQKLRLRRYQKRYCEQWTPRDVVLKSRRIGFTTLEQARDVYHFLTRPGADVVVTCQSLTEHTGSKNLSKNFNVMFESLERLGIALDFETRTNTDWVLKPTKSRARASLRIMEAGASEAAAQKKGRSGGISRLHISETGFYEYADATMNAILDCVPNVEFGSEVVSESTPNGAHGYFYRQCKDAAAGRSGYRLHFIPWMDDDDCSLPLEDGERIAPRGKRQQQLVQSFSVTPEQLKWYQRKVAEKGSQDLVEQEYPTDPETCFLVSGRCFFDLQKIAASVAKATPHITSDNKGFVRVWELPKPGALYVLAADTSEGGGGDPSAGIVMERGTGRHVATLHGQLIPWDLAHRLAPLGRYYNNALIAVERNNHGHAVLQALERSCKYRNLYRHMDGKLGWLTNDATRTPMLDAFDAAHRRDTFVTNDTELLSQMRTFITNDNGKPEAAPGEHDDLVIGTAIAWAVVTRPVQRYDLSNLEDA